MSTRVARFGALFLAGAMALVPAPSEAIAPLLLVVLRQIAQDAAKSMLKDMLLSSLRDTGCKGMALADALEGFNLRSAASGAGRMATLPAGMTMPALPAGMAMPNLAGAMGGGPKLPAGLGMAMGGGLPQGIPADVAAKMGSLMPGVSGMGQLPAGMALDPDQMAALASIQQAMSQPLSPPETLAAIDTLLELGFLPKAMHAELKECMLLVPAAAQALGMGMGMLKPMIPQLRQAREELHALPVAEQDEVAAALAQDLKALPPSERTAAIEYFDSGFFPKRVSEGVKARLQGDRAVWPQFGCSLDSGSTQNRGHAGTIALLHNTRWRTRCPKSPAKPAPPSRSINTAAPRRCTSSTCRWATPARAKSASATMPAGSTSSTCTSAPGFTHCRCRCRSAWRVPAWSRPWARAWPT